MAKLVIIIFAFFFLTGGIIFVITQKPQESLLSGTAQQTYHSLQSGCDVVYVSSDKEPVVTIDCN